MNIKMAKDMNGSPDGIYIHTFKKDEVYEIGTWPMTQALADTFMAVPGAASEEATKSAAAETGDATTAEITTARTAQAAIAAREAEQARLDAEAADQKDLAAQAPVGPAGPSEIKLGSATAGTAPVLHTYTADEKSSSITPGASGIQPGSPGLRDTPSWSNDQAAYVPSEPANRALTASPMGVVPPAEAERRAYEAQPGNVALPDGQREVGAQAPYTAGVGSPAAGGVTTPVNTSSSSGLYPPGQTTVPNPVENPPPGSPSSARGDPSPVAGIPWIPAADATRPADNEPTAAPASVVNPPEPPPTTISKG